MTGCSSSHTAGPYYIAKMFRHIAGGLPKETVFAIEPGSSLSCSYHEQGSDLAMIMGLLDIPFTDSRFKNAFAVFPEYGTNIEFKLESFPEAVHPNSIKMTAESADGKVITAVADSTGGGSILFRFINNIAVSITGDKYHIIVSAEEKYKQKIQTLLEAYPLAKQTKSENTISFQYDSTVPIPPNIAAAVKDICADAEIYYVSPVFLPIVGEGIFSSAAEMLSYADKNNVSLGEAALEYESRLLRISKDNLNAEMDKRLQVMIDAVHIGLSSDTPQMFLLSPTADKIMNAERQGRLSVGGIHTRACARAIAAMQVNSGQGIVCAAPTGGSAGVLPGVIVTMMEDMNMDRISAIRALWAAGAVGMILSTRGTFAAEVCGCQVEVGAAGAMGAAAVIEAHGGNAAQACDAASIVFHNAMGLICDLVQSMVEVPCHTRNGSFASQSFLCADMILGGYHNYISLDETIDAVVSVGHMLPQELRCTSLGGIAITKSALQMKKLRA